MEEAKESAAIPNIACCSALLRLPSKWADPLTPENIFSVFNHDQASASKILLQNFLGNENKQASSRLKVTISLSEACPKYTSLPKNPLLREEILPSGYLFA